MLDKHLKPQDIEGRIYDTWEGAGVFACDVESSAQPFTIMMPPPNVTGSLHMGHALNMSLQDILIRYHRKRGEDALWQPGTDHAGIATQMVVERQLNAAGQTKHDLGRDGFIERVWEWKAESGGTITQQLRRLGASPDWPKERFTMDDGLSKAVTKVFVQLYREGLIYRDKRLVNWDPKLHTAVSDIEVDQVEIAGKFWHFRYPLEGDPSRGIVVATTRPETMLGDTAVAVNPEDPRYQDLIGKNVVLPLSNRPIPIIADDHADPEQGSGAVKITPAHDFNDFEVGKRHDLPMINIFDADARLNDAVPEAYRGLDRYEARKRVVADIDALGLLEQVEDRRIMMPHGERSGVVIEPWLTDQWYVDAATLAKPAIEAVEQGRTVFVPKSWEKTYFEWMRNIQPWCISRQLWWGHQIPVWYGPDGAFFVEEGEEAALAAARAHYGQDDVALTRDEDVLDTWFSSGLWPFSTLGWPDETPELARYYPGDVLITGFDIIFFWVARMMMMGLHFMGEVPFRTVYLHALVRDEKGQKMSKSRGNVMDPLDLVDGYGADALRFTLAAFAAQGRDVKMSAQRVEGYRNFTTKLWNATRFCAMNEAVPDPAFDPTMARETVNRWIIGETMKAAAATAEGLDDLRFNEAAGAAYHFTWGTFCDWYLEFCKPILTGDDEKAKAETRATMAWVLDQILDILNPFMPFVTEELFADRHPGSNELLITRPWPRDLGAVADAGATAEMGWVVRLIQAIRSVRADMNVPAGAIVPMTLKDAGADMLAWLERHGGLIERLARVTITLSDTDDVPKGAVQTVVDQATVVLPLAGVIDIDQEKNRLTKEITKLEVEIGKIDKKLGNAQFIAKAPSEVVEEQHARKANAEVARDKLREALARLEAI